MPMICRRCASRSASRWRALSTSPASWTQRGVRRSVLENRNWSQQSARSSWTLRRLVGALELAHVALDLGQQLAALAAALRLRHQPLLELQAEVADAGCRSRARWPWPGSWPCWPGRPGGWLAAPGGSGPAAAGGRPARAAPGAARAATMATSPQPCARASATRQRRAQPPRSARARLALERFAACVLWLHWQNPRLRRAAFGAALLRLNFSSAIMGSLRQAVNAAQLRPRAYHGRPRLDGPWVKRR